MGFGVEHLLCNKKHFRELVIRNGYFLPPDDAFCTVNYMLGVVTEEFYCPKYSDLRMGPCPVPPGKDLVVQEVLKVLAEKKLSIGPLDKACPERPWLLAVLSTLCPQHVFFSRSYVPPPRPGKEKKSLQPVLPAGFFDNMPQPSKKQVKKANMTTANKLARLTQKKCEQQAPTSDWVHESQQN